MSNIACALAAAGHLDDPFMQLLGDAAATRLKGAPRVTDHVQGLRALRILCWLSVGFARLGVLHAGLFEQVALYGESSSVCVCVLQLRTVSYCAEQPQVPWSLFDFAGSAFGKPDVTSMSAEVEPELAAPAWPHISTHPPCLPHSPPPSSPATYPPLSPSLPQLHTHPCLPVCGIVCNMLDV